MRAPRRLPLTLAGLLLAAIVAGACTTAASPTASPTSTPTATPSPTASPSAESTGAAGAGISADAQAYIDALTGYEVIGLPPAIQEELAGVFAADPVVAESARGFAVGQVSQDGQSAGFILAIEVDPLVAGQPNMDRDFAEGITSSSGIEPEEVTIEGMRAFQFESADLTGIAWIDENLAVMAFGGELAELTTLAEALIAANA